MLDALQQGFFLFANWQNLMLLGLGVTIGTFVGAVPGMTTPMAVALTLPFTFTLHPVSGILIDDLIAQLPSCQKIRLAV